MPGLGATLARRFQLLLLTTIRIVPSDGQSTSSSRIRAAPNHPSLHLLHFTPLHSNYYSRKTRSLHINCPLPLHLQCFALLTAVSAHYHHVNSFRTIRVRTARRGEARQRKQSKSPVRRAHAHFCSLTDSPPLILRHSILHIGKIRPGHQGKEAQARIAERSSSQPLARGNNKHTVPYHTSQSSGHSKPKPNHKPQPHVSCREPRLHATNSSTRPYITSSTILNTGRIVHLQQLRNSPNSY